MYLVEEILVDHIFDSFDFVLCICCLGGVAVHFFQFLELAVLRLEVLRFNVRRRVAVQKLPLHGISNDSEIRVRIFLQRWAYQYTDGICEQFHTQNSFTECRM